MHKLLRYYSQNRLKIWVLALAIVFVIVMIQVLNNIVKEQNKQNTKERQETASNVVSYRNESKTIIGKSNVPESYQEIFGNVIDKFYTYCINHEPEKAYELLAPDTKRVLYQTQNQFEKLYYEEKFQGNKEYAFQSWSNSVEDIYIYQVRIFDNMLTTGKTNKTYVEDYVTIVQVEDQYKLNINGYIGRKNRNRNQSNDVINVEVINSDIYLDYEIYNIRVQNKTNKTIILDSQEKTNTTYLTNENGIKFEAFLYELSQEDLELKPKETKTIQIKFNNVYNKKLDITSMNFIDIVEEGKDEKNKLKIEL